MRTSLAARLIEPSAAPTEPTNPACCIEVRAPVRGRVLEVNQESEGVVQPGSPLIQIGDPVDLEIVADLLSSDAVQSIRVPRCESTAGMDCRSPASEPSRPGRLSQSLSVGN